MLPVRNLHLTSRLRYDEPLKPSSKIEETVQALKEKAKEKEKQKTTSTAPATKPVESEPITRVASKPPVEDITKPVPVKATEGSVEPAKPVEIVAKMSLREKIWAEVLHYYHGFRLLGLDIKLSIVLAWRILNGKQLTRREHNLVSIL